MANGKITSRETIESAEIIAQFDAINEIAVKVLNTFNNLQKAGANIKTPTQGVDILKQRNKLDLDALKVLKSQEDLQGKILNNKKREIQLENAKNRAARSGGSTNLAQFRSLNNEYQQQSRLLNELRNRYKALGIQQLQGNKLTRAQRNEYKSLGREVRRLDAQLKKVDAAAGQFSRNVGNYPRVLGAARRSIRSFLGAFGFTSGIFLFVSALRTTLGIFKEFDQSQADLAAILGRSKDEIGDLTAQAKELGATTAFTATQVSQLQLELAKLGFDDKQIIAAVQGVENLAIATGVDAARAAKLAGAALRGFNLDASESNRVAATLAVSTTKSASSFETLETSLPKVSAIANAFNFTIEDTTALLGGLQNAGFEASIAGTSLRQIFLQLADSNGTLAKRLGGGAKSFDELIEQFKKVEKEGISLAEAFDLTNARSVAAFKVFLQGADDLKTLRDSITDAEEELNQLAETKLDSLTGDITLLKSAFEGLVLSIEDGRGEISLFFRDAVQGITDFFTGLREVNTTGVEAGVLAARKVVADFKNSTEIIQGETKEFIVKTIQEADKNISILQERVNELRNQGKIGELFTPNYFDRLEEAEKALEKEKSSRDELIKILKEEGQAKQDLVERTAKLAVLAGAEKGNEIDLSKQILFFQTLSVEQLERLNKEYADYLKSLDDGYEGEKKKGKAQKFYVEGSIGRLEQLIAKEKEHRKATALTTEAYAESTRKIEEYEAAIKKLITGREDLQKIADAISSPATIEGADKLKDIAEDLAKYLGGNEITKGREEIERFVAAANQLGLLEDFELGANPIDSISVPTVDDINDNLNLDLDKKAFEENEREKTRIAREQAELRKGILTNVLQASQDIYGIDLQLFIENIQDKEAGLEDYAEAARQSLLSLNEALLDGTLFRLDQERDANRAKLDQVLNDENATEEQKRAAEERYDKQEAEIKRKQFEANKKAAIAQNIINTAVAITQAYAQLGPIGGSIAGAFITALSLIQLANIKKQKPPQFFRGKKEGDNYEGLATWNEHRPEVNVDKDGNVVFGRKRNELRYVSREDIIHPSIPDFHKAVQDPSTTTYQRVQKSLVREHQERTRMVVMEQKIQLETSEFRKLFRDEFELIANRPIKIPKLEITDKRKSFGI